MARQKVAQALLQMARSHPETEEGVACAGTVIEKHTVKVRNRAFLFLGQTDAMLKLDDSFPEARKLAAKEPGRYKPGAGGWVKLTWNEGEALPQVVLKRWIGESYRLMLGEKSKKATTKKRLAKSKSRKRT
jgi:hypothetical protein